MPQQLPHTSSSSSAKADDPVLMTSRLQHGAVITGYRFRGYDSCGLPQALSLIRPHPLDHLLDMRDRGFRQNAVAEVEDQPPGGEIRKHVVDRAIERSTTGDQRQRIEIALN